MFSSITEAWNNDPIKEITDRLAKTQNQNQTQTQNQTQSQPQTYNAPVRDAPTQMRESDSSRESKTRTKAKAKWLDTPSYSNLLGKKGRGLNTSGSSASDYADIQTLSLGEPSQSEGYSLRFLSDSAPTTDSGYATYAPAFSLLNKRTDLGKWRPRNYRRRLARANRNSIDCSDCSEHIQSCYRCHDRLRDLVNRKIDDIMLENRLRQAQEPFETFTANSRGQSNPQAQAPTLAPVHAHAHTPNPSSSFMDNNTWKDTAIVVLVILVVFLILFLIIRIVNK